VWTKSHRADRIGFLQPLDRGSAGKATLEGRLRAAGRLATVPVQQPGGERCPDEPGGEPPRYVLTRGELQTGACGAAAPLTGVTGVEGSVGVVMLSDEIPDVVGPRVVEAAREVSEALR